MLVSTHVVCVRNVLSRDNSWGFSDVVIEDMWEMEERRMKIYLLY